MLTFIPFGDTLRIISEQPIMYIVLFAIIVILLLLICLLQIMLAEAKSHISSLERELQNLSDLPLPNNKRVNPKIAPNMSVKERTTVRGSSQGVFGNDLAISLKTQCSSGNSIIRAPIAAIIAVARSFIKKNCSRVFNLHQCQQRRTVNNSQNNPQAMPCKDKNTHSTNKKKNYGNPIDLILLGYNFFVFLFVHVFSSLAGTYILCLRGSINSEPTVVNVNRGEPMTEHKRPLIYRFKLRIMRGLLDVLAKIGLIPS